MRPLTRLALGLGLSVSILPLASSSVGADGIGGVDVTQTADGDTELTVEQLGRLADGSNSSSGGTVSCTFHDSGLSFPGGAGSLNPVTLPNVSSSDLVEDQYYWAICTDGGRRLDDRYFRYRPGQPAVSAEFLAYRAHSTLTIAFPEPATSPAIEHNHLVGLATWLWIDPAGFEPISATAAIPGLSVTATATPTQITWNMGDDSDPVVCDDAGTAYDTDQRPEHQETDCRHVYQWHGVYPVTATTTWQITWSASNGETGTLPTVERTTSFDLTVLERQAVIITDP